MRLVFALLAFGLVAGLAQNAQAQIDDLPKVHARLIAERDTVAPGETVTVALEQDIRLGWHTYWQNPGDVGEPTEIKWTLPPGWQAGPIQWPYPKALPVGPFMDYGYEGKPWLLVNVTAPKDAQPGPLTLKAAADWLVCKEVCVPEDATLTSAMTVASSGAPAAPRSTEQAFVAARAKLPTASPWPIRYRLTNNLDLFVASPSLAAAKPMSVEFFPFASGEIKGIAKQDLGFASNGLILQMAPSKKFRIGAPLAGVLVLKSSDGSVQALNVDAREGVVPPVQFTHQDGMTLLLALGFAFLGGLILNLMPCVLPVLAMKALAIASHAGQARGRARSEGLAYAIGAILSFVAFGLAIVVLRTSGSDVGWGFQLQEPVIVGAFALLMFAVGLNLSGVYEIAPISAGDALTQKGGAIGSFFTGVLAVAIAAPCTAPFMAAALGFALTQSSPIAVGVFAALGLGFAAPFILLALWPQFHRLLPRPGAWMLALRRWLALPMYGAAIWLLWVLAQQTTRGGVGVVLAAMALLGLALWLWGRVRSAGTSARIAGDFGAAVALAAALACLVTLPTFSPASAGTALVTASAIPSEAYTAARLDELRREHRPIFIDATAAWCITCLVNDSAALSLPAVRDAFARNHVAFLVADWTRRDPEITALLEANGRSGVPLYLYYPPGASEPLVLPQILTEGEVIDALGGKRS